jgi:hypothetical protein
MMNRLFAAALPLMILAGCATDQPPQSQEVAAAKPQCEREYRIGSNLPKKDCAPPMTAEERERLNAELRNIVKPNASSPPGK